MEDSGIARGNSARQANKKLREQRILNLAVHLIASDGMEDFTINPLRDRNFKPHFSKNDHGEVLEVGMVPDWTRHGDDSVTLDY